MVALSTRFAALALTLVVVDALPLPMNVEDAASGPSLFNAFHDHGDHHDKVVIVNGDHKHVEAKRSLVNIGGKPVDFLGDGLDICIGSRCTRDQPQTSYLRSRIVGRNALVSERQLETPLVHEGASSERHISSRIVGRRAVDDVKPRADPGSGGREDYARRDQSKRYLGLNGLDAHVDALPVAEAEVVLPRSWSRVMRPILGARSNAAAQSSRRSDDSPSGVSGTIALMTPNGSGANMTQVASLALGDPTAAKLVFDASAVNSTEVTLKAVSSDSLMAANIDMDSLSSSRIPVTLSVSAFDSSKAMMKDLCTTFDPAPSTPVKFELEDCFDGSNPAHKSQLFTYDSNTGELQPLWQTQPASDASDEDDEDDEDDEKDSTDTQSQGGAVDPPTPKGGNLAVITDFAEDDYPVDASHPPMMAAAVMSRNGSTSSSSVGPKPSMASVAGTNGTASSSSTNSSSASAASTNSTMHSSATNSNSTSNPAPNTVNGQSVVLIFKPVAGLSVSKSSPASAAAAAATTTTSQTAQSGSGAAMPTVSMVGAARVSTSTVSTTSSSTATSASDNASGYDLEMVPVSNSATPAATMKSRRDDQDPVLPLPPAATTAASSTMRKRMHARDLVASSDVMPLAASTSYSPISSSASAPSPTMNRRHARDITSSSPDSNSSVEEYAAQMLTVNLPPPSPTSAPPTSASPTPAPSTASSSSMVVTSSAMSEPTTSSSSMVVTPSATPEPTISSSTVADTVTMTPSEPAVTMEPPAGRRRSFRFSRNVDV